MCVALTFCTLAIYLFIFFDVHHPVSRGLPRIHLTDPSSLCSCRLIGVYRAPLIILLVALLKESQLLAHSLLQMTASTRNRIRRKTSSDAGTEKSSRGLQE